MKARIALSLVVVAAATIPLLASAEHLNVRDTNDTQGKLDVRVVRLQGTEAPAFNIIMFPRWTARQIWDRGYVLVLFDTFGNPDYDYRAMVRSKQSSLEGILFRIRANGGQRRVADLSVWREGPKHLAVSVPLDLMRVGESRTYYRWYVETLFTSNNCPDVCFDLVPSESGVIEPLSSPSPTPSQSPSPTIVP